MNHFAHGTAREHREQATSAAWANFERNELKHGYAVRPLRAIYTMPHSPKLCTQCVYGVMSQTGLMRYCHAPQTQRTSLVDGTTSADPCYIQRACNGHCGPDAKFHEQVTAPYPFAK